MPKEKRPFSERIGARKPREVLQIEAVDDELRRAIWNLICVRLDSIEYELEPWHRYGKGLAVEIVSPVDEVPGHEYHARKWWKSRIDHVR